MHYLANLFGMSTWQTPSKYCEILGIKKKYIYMYGLKLFCHINDLND